MDVAKAAVYACMWLYCSMAKQKPCTPSGCKAKEKPRQRGGVKYSVSMWDCFYQVPTARQI